MFRVLCEKFHQSTALRYRRLNSIAIIGVLTMMISALPQQAEAVSINFDTFPNNSIVPNNTVITTQYASLGVTFSSPAPAGGPLAGVLAGEVSSPPHSLYGFDPVTQAGLFPILMDITGALPNSLSVALISVGNATVTATAFASDLVTVLDMVSVTHGSGAGVGLDNIDPITLHGIGIARVSFAITQTGPVLDGFGIDDVVFTPETGPSVPEPGTWLLLTTGLAGLLSYGWRRRRAQA